MKKLLLLLPLWLLATSTFAADEMLSNPGFEDTSTSPFFGTTFDDWSATGITLDIETTDKVEGEQALKVTKASRNESYLSQEIAGNFESGATYRLRIKYKVLTSQSGSDVKLNCYWESPRDGKLDHDSDKLITDFFTASDWTEKAVETTLPEGATRFYFNVMVAKNASVLFDDFSFQKVEGATPTEPTLNVSPNSFTELSTRLNQPIDYPTVTIQQANLSQPVTISITGKDSQYFSASVQSTTEPTQEVIFTYNPTVIGRHTATVSIESAGNYELTQTFQLKGYCIDPNNPPTISLEPATIPAFTAKVNERSTAKATLSSQNCIDYVRASIEHIEGAAFSISSTLFVKNISNPITFTFAPNQAGNYHSKIHFTTLEGKELVVDLKGTATAGDTPVEDPLTRDFNWNMSNPREQLFETFDSAVKNENLQLEGWQNVVRKGERPWWGYELDGEKMAKASGYVYQEQSNDSVEMWIVTPPLSYNTAGKTFTFRVMGENMFENCPTKLELYYIDTIPGSPIFFQSLEAGIPATPDQNGEWNEIHVNLEGQNINDVFFMAFKYTGLWGNENAVTYYIDDIGWGRTDLPEVSSDSTHVSMVAAQSKDQVSGKITVTGKNLTEPIKLSLGGANPSKFKLSTTSLPAAGGSFTVSFNSTNLGVHEAYVKLASRGAADKYIPLSVLVKSQSGINTANSQAVSIAQQGTVVSIMADGLQQVSLYTTSGIQMGQYAAENGLVQISHLARGIYILQATTATGNSTHKVIVR
ncbi:choice-of-anchor J domain-containing protein [Barnesiella sp. An55]|uniref:T9SS-dependent choice-of-anchor J family protein n=1 Tax=Barnesiella sp. An55 TaxID=1965646 RepID=UPI000B37044B|nr:choice-of-anchor J domain-containing protein [Barnesiella sp. An55]OUN72802.1 hypothetical protein B5G10_06435 [Barnesiella sp. An55]